MKWLVAICWLMLALPVASRAAAPVVALPAWISVYDARYLLKDSGAKLVDNFGNGFEELYGSRNFRAVLFGVLYRGGANNYYHRSDPRDNNNPLPDDGLENLCEEGFSNAIYLYSKNYSSAPQTVSCTNLTGGPRNLEYSQISPYTEASIRKMLDLVHFAMNGGTNGPIYMHCWNGWHASGLIAAYALRQFCGWGGTKAVAYWEKNTDGSYKDPAFKKLKKDIQNFKPYKDLLIAQDWQTLVCPP